MRGTDRWVFICVQREGRLGLPVMNSPASRYAGFPRHANNVGAAPTTILTFRENKNPHAVALGHMTSKAKAEAAAKNGQKGGRPEGS